MNAIVDLKNNRKYEVIKLIKKTAFSSIVLVSDKNGKEFACKIISELSIQKKKFFNLLKAEISINEELKHENIMSAEEIFKDLDNYYIITPFCPDGTLIDLIERRKKLEEDEIEFIVYEILKGLEYLKSMNIIHRDIKPGNIILEKQFPDNNNVFKCITPKIFDFNLSYEFSNSTDEHKRTSFVGSPATIAPEVLISYVMAKLQNKQEIDPAINAECQEIIRQTCENQVQIKEKYKEYQNLQNGYSYEVDVWGVGCIMYYLMYGQMPVTEKNESRLFSRVIEGKYLINTALNPGLSQNCIDFMEHLLQPNKNDRFTLEQALESDWLASGIMLKLKYLPHEFSEASFDAANFYSGQPDIYNYNESLTERINMLEQNLIEKPITIPTIDFSFALTGLGLLEITEKKSNEPNTPRPFEPEVNIENYLIKNFYQFTFDNTVIKLPNPIKFPPTLLENQSINRKSFELYAQELSAMQKGFIENYELYRSDMVENAAFLKGTTNLPAIELTGEKVLAFHINEKYGEFYLLKNGTISCIFNDQTLLILSPNGKFVDYHDYPPKNIFPQENVNFHRKYCFRVEPEYFDAFFNKQKLRLAQYYKAELLRNIRPEEAKKNFNNPTVLDISPHGGDAPEEVGEKESPEESETLDVFIGRIFDLFYDNECRYFSKGTNYETIEQYIEERYKRLSRQKQKIVSQIPETVFVPNLLIMNDARVLNLVLAEEIISLIENEYAYFGENMLISSIAAAIDLNSQCLKLLEYPMAYVKAFMEHQDCYIFRFSNGDLQITSRQTRLFITHQFVCFENEEAEELLYNTEYFRAEGFNFEYGKGLLEQAVEICDSIGI